MQTKDLAGEAARGVDGKLHGLDLVADILVEQVRIELDGCSHGVGQTVILQHQSRETGLIDAVAEAHRVGGGRGAEGGLRRHTLLGCGENETSIHGSLRTEVATRSGDQCYRNQGN